MVNICIYIPTYNRPKSLYRQIKTITSQISNIDNIRIVVNDNNSSNNCNDYIKHEFKNIEYKKNIYNIGGNANILLGFLNAKMNEFLWILSDDDLLNIDSIKNIYDNIKEEYDFIYVSNVNEAKEINITDSDEYIKFAEIGRISCILYNMNVFCKYIETGFVHHNSSFPHLAIQMAAINDNKKIKGLMLPKNLIFSNDKEIFEYSGNYSMSYTGFPQLAMLIKNKKKFCNKWISLYGEYLYKYKNEMYFNYKVSRIILLYYSSFIFKIYILFINIFAPLIFGIKNILKKLFSKKIIQKLDQYRNKIC